MNRIAFIALGANLGDPTRTFEQAIQSIGTSIGPIQKVSSFYKTKALIAPDAKERLQPDYLNGVLSCQTSLLPEEILAALLKIELALGRDRSEGVRWGPRVIDLDLLAVDNLVVSSERLTLPHPEIQNRDFVLVPFAQIAPEYVHPVLDKSIAELLAAIGGCPLSLLKR